MPLVKASAAELGEVLVVGDLSPGYFLVEGSASDASESRVAIVPFLVGAVHVNEDTVVAVEADLVARVQDPVLREVVEGSRDLGG